MKEKVEHWDMIIEGKTSLFSLQFKDVWRYRDLLMMFVKRDFISFYKQTILGPIWFFVQPIFTTIVFSFVFGKLAGISTDGLPQYLFYLSGITAWNYFADCITKTSTVFRDNANIFGKVYFPRLIMPLSIITSNLIRFGVQFALFLIMLFYFNMKGEDVHVTSAALLFPYLILLMALLGLGVGLIISALTTKYRDLSFLVSFGVQLLMYGTTIIYPLHSAPRQYRYLLELNPMTFIIEMFRYAFLGRGEHSVHGIIYATSVSVILFILGVVIFNKTEKNFVDTI